MQLSSRHKRWINRLLRKRVLGSAIASRVTCFAIALLLVILSTLPSQALSVQDVSNPRHAGGWVTDQAALLSPPTQAQINKMLTALEAKNGTEMVVVTVPNTAPSASPKAFATQLFNTWHIGKVGRDNGVLVLISKEDRRVEVETGYGVEAVLPDARVGNIIRTQIIPAFKQKKFEAGILAGTTALVQVLDAMPSSQTTAHSSIRLSSLVGLVGLVGLGLVAVGYGGMLVVALRPTRVHPEGTKRFEGVSGKQRHTKHEDFKTLPVIRLMIPDFGKRGNSWFWIAAVGFALVGGGLFASWATPSTSLFLILLMIVPCSLISPPFLFAIHLLLAPQTRSQVVKHYLGLTLDSVLVIVGLILYSFSWGGILVVLLLYVAVIIWNAVLGEVALITPIAFFTFCVGLINLGLAFFLFDHLQQEDKQELRLQRPIGCLRCKSELQEVSKSELDQYLTPGQHKAVDLGNMQYKAWYCPTCLPLLTGEKIYLFSCLQDDQLVCRKCNEATLTCTTQVVETATTETSGKQKITSVCNHCDDCQEQEVIIPRIVVAQPPANSSTRYSGSDNSYNSSSSSNSSYDSSSSSSSDSSWSSGSDSSSWSSGSDSSSSGDFGGGSSGGGGAGDSW